MLAPGECGDGSGNWMPALDQARNLHPICPSSPLFRIVDRHHQTMRRTPILALGALEDEWVNPCGGMRWTTLADGRIQLENGTIPAWAPGSNEERIVQLTWQNWGPEFRSASSEFGVPLGWLVAIATSETGFVASNKEHQRTIVSSDGFSSVGIMQPIPSTTKAYGYSLEDRYDPQKNINIGAEVLLDDAETANGRVGGFPVVAAMYNGGSGGGGCRTGNDVFNLKGYRGEYATRAIKNLNTAIGFLPRGFSKAAIGIGIAGVGLAAAALLLRKGR